MNDRPALFVRAEDEDGGHGWGEVWCNFPPAGAEHRTRLINEMLAPMFKGRAQRHQSRRLRRDCGEGDAARPPRLSSRSVSGRSATGPICAICDN